MTKLEFTQLFRSKDIFYSLQSDLVALILA